ncbi:MAG: OmpH family outer membrane protein [Desulfovibrio sp.]|nr:OmpH family outer membrane protein [Desulfovibrio sp.]
MTRYLLLALAALLLSNTAAFAADAAAVPPAKIGVVDMQTVATESDPAKAAKEQMEAKYGKERAALEKQGAALKKQAEALKNPKSTEQKKVDFLKAKQKLDNETRSFVRKVEQDEVKLRQDMVTLVFSATYEVARAKGFNFVVDVTAGGVLYADQSMDLTQDVLAEVNRIYAANKDKKAEAPKPDAQKPAAQPKK